MSGIEVQVTDEGPATFEVVFQDRRGRVIERDPRDLQQLGQEIEELAFGLVHQKEVRPLPAGAIRVRSPPTSAAGTPSPTRSPPRLRGGSSTERPGE